MNRAHRRAKACVTLLWLLPQPCSRRRREPLSSRAPYWAAPASPPAHPQAKDPLTFTIIVWHVTPPDDLVLTKTTYGPGNAVMFDVVAVPPDATAMFPGYQTDSVSAPGGTAMASGTFGPLPAGQYTVTTSFRIYDSAQGFIVPCPGVMTSPLFVYGDDGLSPVIEYYDSNLDHYFMTQSPVEIAALDSGLFAGWVRTGQSFLAYRPNQGNTGSSAADPVRRYYGFAERGAGYTLLRPGSERRYPADGSPISRAGSLKHPMRSIWIFRVQTAVSALAPRRYPGVSVVERPQRQRPPLYDRSRDQGADDREGLYR